MEKYIKAEMEIIEISSEDIVTTSGSVCDVETPEISFGN